MHFLKIIVHFLIATTFLTIVPYKDRGRIFDYAILFIFVVRLFKKPAKTFLVGVGIFKIEVAFLLKISAGFFNKVVSFQNHDFYLK